MKTCIRHSWTITDQSVICHSSQNWKKLSQRGSGSIWRKLTEFPSISRRTAEETYSTETALLKAINDLLLSADRGEVRALCLLDLSTTFCHGRPEVAAYSVARWSVWGGWQDAWLVPIIITGSDLLCHIRFLDVWRCACSVFSPAKFSFVSLALCVTHSWTWKHSCWDGRKHTYVHRWYSTVGYIHWKTSDTTDAVAKLERCKLSHVSKLNLVHFSVRICHKKFNYFLKHKLNNLSSAYTIKANKSKVASHI